MSSQKKAVWDPRTTEHFVKACLNQVQKGERNGTTLTKKGWKAAIEQFNGLIGRNYDRTQLKNKWDSLKKEWSVWHKLFAKEIGLGWDSVKMTVDAPDEWWEKKELENPQYGKFRYKRLPFAQELTILFKDIVATGQFAWAPSSMTFSNGLLESEDGYRPNLDNIGLDTEEGSGDSEDDSVGATEAVANINVCPSQETSGQISGGKRKRADPGERTSKAKVPAASKIADAISVIANTCRSGPTEPPGTSMKEVMAELNLIDEIVSDPVWYAKCCQMMIYKQNREMFATFHGYEDRR